LFDGLIVTLLKLMKKQKLQGKEAFSRYYTDLLGEQGFSDLVSSFERKNPPVFLFNPEYEEQIRFLWRKSGLSWRMVEWFGCALYWPPEIPFGELVPGYEEKLLYPMNISSLLPVIALDPKPGELILDACGAPGGKTLGICYCCRERKSSFPTHIISNDISSPRRARMRQILDDYQAVDVEVWGRSAETIFKQYPNYFDKILLDAPCSSEKHVWNDPKYLKQWTPNRIKTLHQRQLALLGGLVLALKPGGTLVYSTCAVNTLENEGTVVEFLNKKSDLVELAGWEKPVEGSLHFHTQAEGGFDQSKVLRLLPSQDFDPMFVAKLRRKIEDK
jgi:16S rRNA C967 or C1407 C5-methylase (RsmB/RsmF family)